MIQWINQYEAWLLEHGLSGTLAGVIRWVSVAIVVFCLSFLANWVAKTVILRIVSLFAKRSRTHWDDVLVRHHVFTRLSHLAPSLVVYFAAPLLEPADVLFSRLSVIYMIFAGVWVVFAFLNAVVDIYNTYDFAKNRPIKGFVQIGKIILSVFVGIFVVAILLDRSPWYLVSGLGAMTAVLILVFKDTILGLVASIRLSAHNLVAIGDWIEMPKYGVDGDVIDVSLHHVKVQNFDKTIVTIPSYSMVSDSFKNWRGMNESGGRRIKRSIFLDMTSIRFCTEEMLDRYEHFQVLKDYIKEKRAEIETYNKEHGVDTSELVNGRRLTNIGTFRAYIAAYLRNQPKIHQGLTFLVRQLEPTEHGLPLEIYVFSSDIVWANYEAIQADIFDHLLAVIPEFGLRVFQNPSGADFQSFASGRPPGA